MNVKTLIEGSHKQITNLNDKTPLRLYAVVTPEEMAGAIFDGIGTKDHNIPGYKTMKVDHIYVTPEFGHAAEKGDFVFTFYAHGSQLSAPPERTSKAKEKHYAEKLPTSKYPVVSMSLLTNPPMAYFYGIIRPDDIGSIIRTGYNEKGEKTGDYANLTPKQFGDWYVNVYKRGPGKYNTKPKQDIYTMDRTKEWDFIQNYNTQHVAQRNAERKDRAARLSIPLYKRILNKIKR